MIARVFAVCLLVAGPSAFAAESRFGFGSEYRVSGRLKPQDYLFAPHPERRNDLFDGLRPVDLGVNLAIGADCGRINIEGTLRAAFGKFLSGDYFRGMADDILGSAPMLAACYMSPTWCSILKHTQLSANFLAQTRLNQCQIIDKYVDSRVEDYYRERQGCVQRAIQRNGGDVESALGSCQDGVFQAKAGRWGGTNDDPNRPNQLIADSVRWAGFQGEEADRTSELLKSMVGDTVLYRGNVRVEYGPRSHAYSPRSHLVASERAISDELCGRLVPEIIEVQHGPNYVTDEQIQRRLDRLSAGPDAAEAPSRVITPDVIRNLAHLPGARRERVCAKLAQGLAMSTFTRDMNRALDVLSTAAQNPNLPPNRRQEIEQKRQGLKDQVELTLRLRQEQAKPVGEVMQYIAAEGLAAQDEATRSSLANEEAARDQRSHAARVNDCADGVFCGTEGQP
jgi:hypothetical protein